MKTEKKSPAGRIRPTNIFIEFDKGETEQSIPDRFEKIVRLYPHRLAVKVRDHSLTYEALNQAANRLAHAILAKRDGGNEAIALLFEQGIDIISAIFGTLKAGRFFLPLDPSLPEERITYLLEDSQARLIVHNNQNISFAHELRRKSRQLLNIDDLDESLSAANLGLTLPPDTLGYLIYTSGSTGKPKGVMQNHRNTLHEIMAYTNGFHICAQDRMTLLASCSSGQGIKNAFCGLLNGAALYPFDVKSAGVPRLADHLMREEITAYHSSVTLYRYFLNTLTGEEKFPHLRLIRLASQQVFKEDLESYRTYFSPDCILVNALSSTETGTFRWYFMNKETEIGESMVPVGYAVDGKEVLLLDDQGQEVGLNRVGEIVVKSRYISPGYWRKPDLTKSKFLPDPNGSDGRLYFTGDLGQLTSDGCLIYAGRKDFRVKVRGYSVEVAEIERALRAHRQVKEAAVVAWDREPGEKYLIAYVVPRQNAAPTDNELNDFLEKKLPDYMMPSAYVFLASLPLTNGKLDRTALPLPDRRRSGGREPAPPRNTVEQKLLQIWEEILEVSPIGIHDDFFKLGGHSLLGGKLISRLSEAFHMEVPLRSLFETRTIARLAERIAEGPPEELSLETRPIHHVSRSGDLPLSLSQQRLWFMHQLEPGSSAYNLFSAFHLAGVLDVTALEESFNEIIKRHEALRTVFKPVEGKPLQIILPSMIIKLPVVDLREIVSATERESQVHRLSTAEAQRPFDLAGGPLLRVTLLRLTDDDYVLLLALHHIVFDGWSMGILARELSALYKNFSSGKPFSSPKPRIQYADFAVWQRRRCQGELLNRQLSWWKRVLGESPPVLDLPTDRPRPPVQTVSGARQYFALSKTFSARLNDLSHRHGVTLFMTLLAAYQTLLHRYTGQNDIVIGSPVAGRDRSELENLIGFFLNILVLRADLSGNPTFGELLARVREVCLEAYARQDLPFEKLVEELRPERDLSYNPLFQVTFAFQNTPRFPLELAGLTACDLEVDPGIARFDLHLFMEEEEQGLRGYVDYNTDLFNAETISRMTKHFQVLLEGIVAHPNEPIGSLSLLTDAERHQLLVGWNDTDKDYPRDRCIHQLFEAQVERTPDAVAVVAEAQQLTYRELNRRANQLAHRLQKLGVGPEALVGICMERSLEMIVGLLGILKAGGAYVPFDPEYPKERLAFMLKDSQAPVLLIQQHLVEGLSAHGIELLCLDSGWKAILEESEENPVSGLTADNLAYVIYTSGSTGKPKGVCIPHRGVVRLVKGTDYARLTSREVFLQLAPISFDASTFEIWGCLLNGARLVVFPTHTPSLEELGEALQRYEVTTLWLTASLFHEMVDSELESFRHVRQLLAGGDVLSALRVKEAAQELGDCRLVNGYGPTESTTFACCYPIATHSQVGVRVPIGRPIANTRVYLLDRHLQPVPIGVPGELHIGGDGLARGYLNGPELTAEKFIPNPFRKERGARLYKTGDVARYLPDGNIEFLGRMDHQVKIRGFRIESGEIEAVLGQNPAVREAVVMAREDVTGERRLVAYLVPNHEQAPTVSELRLFLKEKLPEYMVPSAFVLLDGLPLTPNGKVDRRTLPAPDRARPELEATFVFPRTPVEEALAAIWAEVLGLGQVGIHDNFFELGGHSLKATQVMSRLSAAFHVEVPLRALFESPTIAGLAVIITQRQIEKVKEIAGPLAELEVLSDEETHTLPAKELE